MADSFELHLIYATDTKIVRWLKTKSEATPFDERFTEYFEDRDTKRMLREINGRRKLNALYKMQKGICPHCVNLSQWNGDSESIRKWEPTLKKRKSYYMLIVIESFITRKMLMNWFC